jgi:prepilin-type N-terminal cleavage/methylation domain-containing protein
MVQAREMGNNMLKTLSNKQFNKQLQKGFTLLELLVVIGIIGYLASIVITNTSSARDKAYTARSLQEFSTLNQALQMYITDHGGQIPADVSRGLPPGLEAYLPTGKWPNAPWPGSVYDWDVWPDPAGGPNIAQISIRFCPAGGDITTCNFPRETWATNFGVDSAYYYCIQGSCRAHDGDPITYPAKCANCAGTSTSPW